jgi:AraC-like DNA-binding protein
MPIRPDESKHWSLFDLEVPAAGRIEYPLHIGVWESPDTGVLTMDVHQGMEIGFVLRGRMERHYEDFAFLAAPGDIHLCSVWEPHGWRVAEPGTVSVVYIFLPEIMDDESMRNVPWLNFFTAPPRERPRTTTPEMRRDILTLGEIIRREGQEMPPGWMPSVRLLFFYLLLLINRHWQPRVRTSTSSPVPASTFARIMPAVTRVHESPERDITLQEAAALCGLHRSRFGSIFRRTLGVSFTQFQRRARLARVAYLLTTTDLSVQDIACRAGFVDGSHLHRTFLRSYGCTPGQYRAQQRA